MSSSRHNNVMILFRKLPMNFGLKVTFVWHYRGRFWLDEDFYFRTNGPAIISEKGHCFFYGYEDLRVQQGFSVIFSCEKKLQ